MATAWLPSASVGVNCPLQVQHASGACLVGQEEESRPRSPHPVELNILNAGPGSPAEPSRDPVPQEQCRTRFGDCQDGYLLPPIPV